MFDFSATGFYRGFIETKDKKAKYKFKNDDSHILNFKQVQHVTIPEYAGILNDNAVLLDADDDINSNILLDIIKGENLEMLVTGREGGRGVHALGFDYDGIVQKKSIKTMLACGVVIDVIPGSKPAYECLCFNHEQRKIIYDSADYNQIPKYFMPMRTVVDFAGMGEGDGRNSVLFGYILTLQESGFTVEESRECIRLINKYVLQEPLSNDELDVILRDSAFAKPTFYRKGHFLHDKFGDWLINQHKVKNFAGNLGFFDGKNYCFERGKIERLMISEISGLTQTQRKEVYAYLTIAAPEWKEADERYIAFRNGIYDIVQRKLLPHDKEIMTTNVIPWDYNPNAESALVDNVLDKISCNDGDIRALLEEIAGYCFYRRNELGKAFVLIGEQSNGKSTYLDILLTMLGEVNCSTLDLKQLNEKFKTAEIFGKLANIGDDISDEFITDTAIFKKVTSGESLTAERKGEKPFSFKTSTKLLFSTNSMPRLGRGKDSMALWRRLVFVPFNATFSKEDPDYNPYIKYELRSQEAIERFIILALNGMQRVINNKAFTVSKEAQHMLNDFIESNNPLLFFLSEFNDMIIENQPTRYIYGKYDLYCRECGLQAISIIEFSKQICKIFGLKTEARRVDGKQAKVFIKVK